ncbi:peptide deformylase [Streptomyces sp. NBC_00582]|uniref:peptide deformylase n=1 Tax=Streptomyces sp. NBC_00582 TaxID=2975783 RepID=UPI002E81AFA7|nr:peptide deformylase [Streptomyces sp. NBC_00582]WUB68421.1 peptide deformylase [Streptomyces sp. NBC_00582]
MESDERGTFAAELTHWRTVRSLTKKALAARLNVDPSYISHLEAGREHGSPALARRVDTELDAGGALWTAWQGTDASPSAAEQSESTTSTGLLVLEDDAALDFDGSTFHLRMRRLLRNDGTDPVSRYLVRIAVDRYPAEPERSNALYRRNPLTWDELGLEAHCGDEPMEWTVKHDRDAVKELWLKFQSPTRRFPLYPGQEAEITYSYSVSADKWGPWFQRAVRLPTRRLTVELAFPSATEPAVWGTETSLSADLAPLRTQPQRTTRGDRTVFTWATMDPPLHARYRLEWRLKAVPDTKEMASVSTLSASQAMANAGIIQEGDPVLVTPARPFDLPAEADEAERIVGELLGAVDRVRTLHTFGKGMGIAAPQLGYDRSAAVVIPPDPAAPPVVLINAMIEEASADQDEQFEGCLSFFDVRGRVPRALSIVVAHDDLDGSTRLSRFTHGMARLVAHELDHIGGVLYRERMRPGVLPIPVEEYRGTGSQWQYG